MTTSRMTYWTGGFIGRGGGWNRGIRIARSSAQSDAGHYKIEASQKNDADAK